MELTQVENVLKSMLQCDVGVVFPIRQFDNKPTHQDSPEHLRSAFMETFDE